MARIVFGMNLSLDGYVDFQDLPVPDAKLFRHWTEHVGDLAGSIYGRQMYEVMRYWDDDHPDWTSDSTTSRWRGDASRNGSYRAR